MTIESLQAESLLAAQQVAAELFPWEAEHQQALPAAVYPERHPAFYRDRGLEAVRCRVVRHADQVAGLAALYSYARQPDDIWLAWYGLRPFVRGLGLGARLLDLVTEEARREGRSVLRLWTTDEAEYQKAVQLYHRRGFICEQAPSAPGETWKTLVFSLGLNGQAVRPWGSLGRAQDLCGRELPALAAFAA